MIEQLKGWLGLKWRGISLNIDIINGCVLSCPSCAVGSIGRRPSHYMDIGLFERILNKAQTESKIRKVQLYMYSDPAMHPELHLFVQACTDRGIPCLLSTVLQHYKCDWAKVIEARPAEFRVSLAGWDKMRYYQRGADPSRFNHNLAQVYDLPRHPETLWTMAFHLYNDNEHEVPRARALAHLHGFKFVAIPSIFMVGEKVVERIYTMEDLELISHLRHTPEDAISHMKINRKYCQLWKQLAIDAKGDVYLCQLLYQERFRLGMNFMDYDMKDILREVWCHSFCDYCMKMGGHTYQYCYEDFTKSDDPVGHANQKRMND